ncbi:uncharacterized protein LOC142007972 [Carettochelys insculpta]|uniref:uncharacterized protein LOC142007972 n=1 Tax=Carettochelys insculpta TaxID=44489 RepID=UPI003EC110C3
MGSKRRDADAFARLAEGLAARGHPAHTPDHVQSKVKELCQGYAGARDAASRSGAAPVTCPIYRELRDILGPQHTSSPLATLDTSAEEPQQAPEVESTPEASPAPRGPPQEPTSGAPEEEGDSSSIDTGLQILLLPSWSSSRASAPRVSPDRGSGPSAAPAEGPESAGEASVVPESPPGPSLQASPSAEQRLAPRRARWRTQQQQPPVTDPQLLALHSRQVEVAEQWLRVEQHRLHQQEQALAWHQEAWGAYMQTFNRIVDYLAPHAVPAATAPALPAPPTAPVVAPSAVAPPPRAILPRGTWGQLTLAGHIFRSARPPARAAAEAGIPATDPQCWTVGAWGPGRAPPFVYIPPTFLLFLPCT